jgi:hypothetical protein
LELLNGKLPDVAELLLAAAAKYLLPAGDDEATQ